MRKQFLRLLIRGLPFLLLPVFLSCHAGYLIDQGTDLIGLMGDRKPLREAKIDPELRETEKKKIQWIREARTHAEASLGLSVGDQYSTYVPLERDAVSWNITATPWNRVRPIEWTFPFAGSFPYIAFFEKREALAYRDELVAEGHDVYMRPVSAFSTLGWFDDPVYSPMLERPEPLLVETIFHELIHANVFFQNNVSLSESTATEIARVATLSYMEQKHGPDASVVTWTRNYYDDQDRVGSFFRDLEERLSDLYDSDVPDKVMRRRKNRIFRRARRSFAELLDELETGGWSTLLSRSWNNAYVASHVVYNQHTEQINELLKKRFNGNIRETVNFLQSIQASDVPLEKIQSEVESASEPESRRY